jgi:ElaA protein
MPSAVPTTPVPPLRWRWCRFDELSVFELQAIYGARQQVFVVEQACAYRDADGHDASAWHLAAWGDPQPVPWAYARVVHPGRKYPEPSIGRVLTVAGARGTGLGRELMRRALELCTQTYPGQGVRISAQSRLERFYETLGFAVVGAPYLEDGIAHTEMLRAAPAPG